MSKRPKWEYGVQYRPGGEIRSFDDMGEWEACSIIYTNKQFTHRRRYGPREPWKPIKKKEQA